MSGSSSSSWTNQRSALLSRDSCGPITAHLVQELDIAVIHQLSDHRDIGAVHGTLPLQNYGGAKRGLTVCLCKYRMFIPRVVKGYIIVLLCVRTPIVSSKVMALMLSDARMASLSARVGSSLEGTLAERMTHMSHRFTFTARRSALLRGEPCKEES